jgi:hypothetical protein
LFFYGLISGIGLMVLIYFIVLFLALKYPYAGLPKDPPLRGFSVREFGGRGAQRFSRKERG